MPIRAYSRRTPSAPTLPADRRFSPLIAFIMYRPNPSPASYHKEPVSALGRSGHAHSVSRYGHRDRGAQLSPWALPPTIPGRELWHRPSTRLAIGHSRGMAELGRALALTGTTSPHLPESEGVDDMLDEDDLPSVTDILRPPRVCPQPKLIDLTLDSSDEVSTWKSRLAPISS
jgi:hypothetical protein